MKYVPVLSLDSQQQFTKGVLKNSTDGWPVVQTSSVVLNNMTTTRNQTEPSVYRWLDFEVVPNLIYPESYPSTTVSCSKMQCSSQRKSLL